MYRVYDTKTGKLLYKGETDDNLTQRCRAYAEKSRHDVLMVKPSGATSTFIHGQLMNDNPRRLAMLQGCVDSSANMQRRLRRRRNA